VKTEKLVPSIVRTDKTYQYHAHSNYKSQNETPRNFIPKLETELHERLRQNAWSMKKLQSSIAVEERRGNKMAKKRTRRGSERKTDKSNPKGNGNAGSGVTSNLENKIFIL
jgi:hypothetical protein